MNFSFFTKTVTLGYCFLLSFFRGRAVRCITPPKRVTIFQGAKLGDMVCTTPVFRAIKRVYPECEVCVVGSKTNEELLKGSRDVGRYLVFDRNVTRMAAKIKELKPDAVCILNFNFRFLASAYIAGVPCITAPVARGGASPYETFSFRLLRRLVRAEPLYFGEYFPRQYLRFLGALGIQDQDTSKHLAYTEDAERSVSRFLRERGLDERTDLLVGIAPSAGNEIKRWAPEKFARIAEHLMRRHSAKVILVGGKSDAASAKQVLEHVPSPGFVINTVDLFSLDELKALISKLRLFISVDTGPVYIAEAFGIPTVDITGPIDEREQPPIGERHVVVMPPHRKKPELRVLDARSYDEREAWKQSDDISAQMVTEVVDRLMKKLLLQDHGRS